MSHEEPRTIWVLHYDVAHEFGHVLSVHSSEEAAIQAARNSMKEDRVRGWNSPYHEPSEHGGGCWVLWDMVQWSVTPYKVDQ